MRSVWTSATLIVLLALGGSAIARADDVPAWAYSARWYEVHVPAFGEGRLVDVERRLDVIQKLGCNTLYIGVADGSSPTRTTFATGGQHVDTRLDRAATPPSPTDKNDTDGKWTPDDRALIKLIRAAHEKDLRVAVGVDAAAWSGAGEGERAKAMADLARRWMDPNGDGSFSDGVDAWVITRAERLPKKAWADWRKAIRGINSEVLLVADGIDAIREWVPEGPFDTAIDRRFGEAAVRFFSLDNKEFKEYPLERFLADLEKQRAGLSDDVNCRLIRPLGGSGQPRLLSRLAGRGKDGNLREGKEILEAALDRWRMLTVFWFVYPGVPAVYNGDETGMHGASPEASFATLWTKEKNATDYREDFAELIRILADRREEHGPLRRGSLHVALAEADRYVMALSREFDGVAMTTVLNYGEQKQRVALQVAGPSELVAVMSPQLRNPKPRRDPKRSARETACIKIPMVLPPQLGGKEAFNVGAMRQYTDANGMISLPVAPMGARIIVAWKSGSKP